MFSAMVLSSVCIAVASPARFIDGWTLRYATDAVVDADQLAQFSRRDWSNQELRAAREARGLAAGVVAGSNLLRQFQPCQVWRERGML